MANVIKWDSPIGTVLRWSGRAKELPTVHDHREPVRVDNPQSAQYTFIGTDGGPVDLTVYTHAKLRMKKYGGSYSDVGAEFDGEKVDGAVRCDGVKFTSSGIWNIQFILTDDNNVPLVGDICEVRVVDNVADLGASALPEY